MVSKYARKRFELLIRHLKKYGQSRDLELLHEMRLEIKKIKALLNLTEFSVKGFNGHKHFKPIRTIFREAGKIREPEVLYQLLLRYGIDDVGNSLKRESEEGTAQSMRLQLEIAGFIKTVKLSEKVLAKVISKVEMDDVRDFLRNKKLELQEQLESKWHAGVLHKARKMSKEIVYLSGITRKTKRKLDPFFDAIQNAIGTWHDKQVLLPIVKARRGGEVARLKKECADDLQKIKKMIVKFYQ